MALDRFAGRVDFLEDLVRERILAASNDSLLIAWARVTSDPTDLVRWICAHEDSLQPNARFRALGSLGVAGLADSVRLAARGGDEWKHRVRVRVRDLGAQAGAPLLAVATYGEAEAAAFAAGLLAEVSPPVRPEALAPLLGSPRAGVRAGATRSAAATIRAGEAGAGLVPRLVALLEDEDAVRAGALDALAAAAVDPRLYGGPDPASLLDDRDAHVRIAAAEVVYATSGEVDRPLGVLREVIGGATPSWGWIGGGDTPARTVEYYSDEEVLWVEAAAGLRRMGKDASPAAEAVVWAALRHGEPLMQRLLVDAVAAMGPGAATAGPLLRRLEKTHSTWLGHHENVPDLEESLQHAFRSLGLE